MSRVRTGKSQGPRSAARTAILSMLVVVLGPAAAISIEAAWPTGASAAVAQPTVRHVLLPVIDPTGLVAGPDGNVWFTAVGLIGRITPGGTVTKFFNGLIARPRGLTIGSDGNLWFINGVGAIGRITPAGVATEFTSSGIVGPFALTLGPDGNIWFTNNDDNSIGRITPAGTVTSYGSPAIYRPQGIVAGSDGNLWFTNFAGNSIGRISTSGTVTTFTSPSLNRPSSIAAGPDGALWFTNYGYINGGGSIGRITTSGTVTTFSSPSVVLPNDISQGPDGTLWFTAQGSTQRISTAGSFLGAPPPSLIAGPLDSSGNRWRLVGTVAQRFSPAAVETDVPLSSLIGGDRQIATGPDGNLWITNTYRDSIGRITPGGAYTEFTGPTVSRPLGITAGPDGNMWFTNSRSVGRITPTGTITDVAANAADFRDIAVGPDGNLWLPYSYLGQDLHTHEGIGRMSLAGVLTRFDLPSLSGPSRIVAGPDGNLWFTNRTDNSIGRITPTGALSTFTDPSIADPYDIAAGPDGNLWFTNYAGDSIGRITPAGVVSNFTDPYLTGPTEITAGPDGKMWFTASGTTMTISTDGSVNSVTDPTGLYHGDITTGPDGKMWFAGEVYSGSDVSVGSIDTGLPGAPLHVTASPGDGVVAVSWDAPTDPGIAPITSYVVTASPGGATCTWTAGPLTCQVAGLTDGTIHTFVVRAVSSLGAGVGSAPIAATPQADTTYHPIAPVRVQDSRPESHLGNYVSPWGPGTTRTVQVAGVSGIPADARAVAMNVTVTSTTAASFLTIWPTGRPLPLSSNLNWTAGRTIANAVTTSVGQGGTLSIFNPAGSVDVIIDVVGYYTDAASAQGEGLVPLAPVRIQDSRASDQFGPYSTPWTAGTTRLVQAAGANGIPADADAVVLNATVTNATAPSFLTIYPAGATQPNASSLNWTTGQTLANAVTAKIGVGGQIAVFNPSGSVDVILDVVGYFTTGTGSHFHPLDPVRIQDSRGSERVGPYGTPWGPGTTRAVTASPAAGVPAGATAVLLNVTVTGPTAPSFLTIWPAGQPRPNASSLNWVAGQTLANAVNAMVGVGGQISIFNPSGTVEVIADSNGWYG